MTDHALDYWQANSSDEFHGYQPESFEEVQYLRGYDPSKFPIQTMTTDLVVFAEGHQIPPGVFVLLIKRGNWPYKGHWALPGGFVNPNETAGEAARRELTEEAGLKVRKNLHFLMLADAVRRDPRGRVFSSVFLTHMWVSESKLPEVYAGDDARETRWFHLYEARRMRLAFDHNHILETAQNSAYTGRAFA